MSGLAAILAGCSGFAAKLGLRPVRLAALGILLAVGTAAALYVQSLRRANDQLRLDARNARALAATTIHHLHGRTLESRRLVVELSRSALERALLADSTTALAARLQTAEGARLVLGVALARARDSLRARTVTAAAPTVDSAGTITASGHLDATDSMGVDVHATVAIPPDRATSAWTWRILRPPMGLAFVVGCADTNAILDVTGPPAQAFTITSVQQDAQTCRPSSGASLFSLRAPSLPWVAALGTAGILLDRLLRALGL